MSGAFFKRNRKFWRSNLKVTIFALTRLILMGLIRNERMKFPKSCQVCSPGFSHLTLCPTLIYWDHRNRFPWEIQKPFYYEVLKISISGTTFHNDSTGVRCCSTRRHIFKGGRFGFLKQPELECCNYQVLSDSDNFETLLSCFGSIPPSKLL